MSDLNGKYVRGRPAPEILGGYASLCEPLEAAAIVAQWEANDAAGWEAWRWYVGRDAAGEIAAVVPAYLQAGKTAVVYPVRTGLSLTTGQSLLAVSEEDEAPVDPVFATRVRCLDAFARHLAEEQTTLLQVVLPAVAQEDAAVLTATGFRCEAELLYLACDVTAPPTSAERRLQFRPARDPGELAQLIERTYEGTLDCPALNGRRDTDDVVAGYLASSAAGAEWWRIAEENGAVVGCVLTAPHPSTLASELVYMGLIPAVRGRALGGDLIREAQRLARESGMEQSVLAVDATNRPAIAAYERAGYQAFDRRRVWLRSADASVHEAPAGVSRPNSLPRLE